MEMLKKQLAILLIVLLVGMPLLGWPLRAEAAYAFSGGGDGSLGNPYVILTAEDLDNIRGTLLSMHFKLGADIDLSSIPNWIPIGTYPLSPFGGNFDGGHYTISNMTIDSSLPLVGLFGYVQSATALTNQTIKNVRLENVNITSRGSAANVGGLAGIADAWTLVDRVSVSGTITGVGLPLVVYQGNRPILYPTATRMFI
ncbi:hypothetical protein OB236_00820 [Paenibacillus sp. WQ 127069]|uniref:Uncharacterized protein n=1 Tax=Paenibacillus baimaensis TaxID=2982185 RepID=A0ABT2U901_9BACL|nr:hypothetical protein [Paenibacillus sp. WQ 127069]MCU6790656.1 hypothetical protein [Paenibacillus sp. WQ 127069]